MDKTYLGDSVYAEDKGFMIRLTTQDGLGESNEIFLEDSVFIALVDFGNKMFGFTPKVQASNEDREGAPV